MDGGDQVNARNILEDMLLDDSAAPTYLPFSLLQDITNDFSDAQQIGHGGFATVYKGQLWDGFVAVKKLYAIKMIDDDKFKNEVEILMMVKHKNIVRFLGYCSETHHRLLNYQGKSIIAGESQWLLCLEYVPNGNLDDQIKACPGRLKWRECYQIIKGICEGLYYLHQKSILHLDLKPLNILLDNNMVPKIADFGLARWFGENQMPVATENVVGTIGYMAPEYIDNPGVVTSKSDIYSLGVVIMEIMTGKKEHCTVENVLESWKSRLESASEDTALAQIEASAKISMDCMDIDPQNRPSIQDIQDRLDKLDEVETLDGFIQNSESSMLLAQTIPHPGGLLKVKPLEVQFFKGMGNFIQCPVSLTNKTDQHVAFRLMPSDRRRKSCSLEHLVYGGVVPPRSTCTLNLRTRDIQKASNWKEEYQVKSRIMGDVLDFKDLRGQVHGVVLTALYILKLALKKVVFKVAISSKSSIADVLTVVSKMKGIKSLDFDHDKSLLTVVGHVDLVEIVAALRKAKYPAAVASVTNTDHGQGKDVAGPSRA